MTDIERAKSLLENNTIALVKGEEIYVDTAKGIAPMMSLLAEGRDIADFSVADRVVGKAVAMLFVKGKVKEVYAEIISAVALEYLRRYRLEVRYGEVVDRIVNRRGDGLCPMESAVLSEENFDAGYEILKKKVEKNI